VELGKKIEIPSGIHKIELTGPRTIHPEAPISPVIIMPSANIVAENLEVTGSIALEANSKLGPAANDQIWLTSALAIHLTSANRSILRLELGAIGNSYKVAPSDFRVDVNFSEFSAAQLDALDEALISGRTLSSSQV
jgi:hypothetical protein